MNAAAYLVYQQKTVFIPLRYVYPECSILIAPHPRVPPLLCLKSDCPANRNCMETLAKRVFYFFEQVEPAATLMVAYFKHPDRPNSIRAGIFDKELENPRVSTLNVSAFKKFCTEGDTKYWTPTTEYLNIQGAVSLPKIIPVSSLIK